MGTLRRAEWGFLIAGMLWLTLTQGALAGQTPTPKKETATAPVEKFINFEMRAKPWSSVFEWLTEQTGLPFISNIQPPTGTFNFIAKAGKKYTMPEVIDIINEGLLGSKFILIRRENSYTLVPADEKIRGELVPRIRLEDMKTRGNTEIVSVVLPLKAMVAEDFAPEVKKMMGPFGEVVPLATTNQLVLQDSVGYLRPIVDMVQDIEEKEEKGAQQAQTFTHKCRFIRARDAEATLRNFLGDTKQIIELTRPATTGPGGPGGGPRQG